MHFEGKKVKTHKGPTHAGRKSIVSGVSPLWQRMVGVEGVEGRRGKGKNGDKTCVHSSLK